MRNNSEIILPDTSCLILLNKIQELDLLNKVGKSVLITIDVQKEYRKEIPGWIQIVNPTNKNYQKLLEVELDKGEASLIALSSEINRTILIIDDLKGRKFVEKLGLRYSGTLGLILKAKNSGLIKSVKPIIEKIRKTNFRFSENLIIELLKESNE